MFVKVAADAIRNCDPNYPGSETWHKYQRILLPNGQRGWLLRFGTTDEGWITYAVVAVDRRTKPKEGEVAYCEESD